jgi:hypothetical protein
MSQWSSYTHPGSATLAPAIAALAHGSYGFAYTPNATDLAYAGKTFTPADTGYFRFYVFFPSTLLVGTGAGENLVFAQFNAILSDDVRFGVITQSGGAPYEWFSRLGGTQFYSTTNFSLNAWHYVEIYYIKGSGTGGANIYIDGSLDASLSSSAQTVPNQASGIYIGPSYMTATPNGVVYFDDVIGNSTGPIGAYSEVGGGVTPEPSRAGPYLFSPPYGPGRGI